MGLLIQGKPLTWTEMRRYMAYIKKHGVLQFINVWRQCKDRAQDKFLWGDEIEGIVLHVSTGERVVRLALRGHEILEHLAEARAAALAADPTHEWNVTFHPEYANFMVEATPGFPYGGYTSDLRMVELNMRLRRLLISAALRRDELFCTLTNFPSLGEPDTTMPPAPAHAETQGPVCKSSYVPDIVMSPHPRFATLSGNIRRRRGRRVNIKHPLFIDESTDVATAAGNVPAVDERPELRARDDEIHLDAMVFGMGCCCLQVTFQTRSLSEARTLYDQLAVLSPVFLALTANTPFYRGRIADTDVRWDTISGAVDDRTDAERGLPPLPADAADRAKLGVTPASPPSPRADAADHAAAGMPSVMSFTTAQLLEESAPLPVPAHRADPDADKDDEEDDDGTDFVGADSLADEDAETMGCSGAAAGDGSRPAAPRRLSQEPLVDEHPSVGQCVAAPYGALSKSRYSSIDCFIAQDQHYRDEYNDLPFKYDAASYGRLRRAGVDCLLAKHTASLFVRDPLVIFQGKIELNDTETTEHFESIQSTNWRSVRFKPPPLGGQTGWRVEFRTMEVQLTDYENAAFTVFIALLTRAITFFDLNFYIPMTKVEENFRRAHARDAIHSQRFHFRRAIRPCRPCDSVVAAQQAQAKAAAAAAAAPASLSSAIVPPLDCSGSAPAPAGSAAGSIPSASGPAAPSAAGAASLSGLVSPGAPGQWESSNPTVVAASWAKIAAFPNPTEPVAAVADGADDEAEAATAASAAGVADAAFSSVDPDAAAVAAGTDAAGAAASEVGKAPCYLDEMTMEEIMCGKPPCFPGLIPLVRFYLDIIKCDAETRRVVDGYLRLIEGRARGQLLTGAAWQRRFVAQHPAYRRDSRLPREAVYDLALASRAIAEQGAPCADLLGDASPMPMPQKTLDAARAAAALVRAQVRAADGASASAAADAEVEAAADAAVVTAVGGVPAAVPATPTKSRSAVASPTKVPAAAAVSPLCAPAAVAGASASLTRAGAPEVIVMPGPRARATRVGSTSGSELPPSEAAAIARDAGAGVCVSDDDADDDECDHVLLRDRPVPLRGASFARELEDPNAGPGMQQYIRDIIQRSGSPGLPGGSW